MSHKLIHSFGRALCTKCGLPVDDETEPCMFGFLADGFTGEPNERVASDRRDDKAFVKI